MTLDYYAGQKYGAETSQFQTEPTLFVVISQTEFTVAHYVVQLHDAIARARGAHACLA